MKICNRCKSAEILGKQAMCTDCKKAYDTEHAKHKYNLRQQALYDKDPAFRCPKCFKKVFGVADIKNKLTKKYCNTCDILVDLDGNNEHKFGRLIDHKVYKDNHSSRPSQYEVEQRISRKRVRIKAIEEKEQHRRNALLFDSFTEEQVDMLLSLDDKRKGITRDKSMPSTIKKGERKKLTKQIAALKRSYKDEAM